MQHYRQCPQVGDVMGAEEERAAGIEQLFILKVRSFHISRNDTDDGLHVLSVSYEPTSCTQHVIGSCIRQFRGNWKIAFCPCITRYAYAAPVKSFPSL